MHRVEEVRLVSSDSGRLTRHSDHGQQMALVTPTIVRVADYPPRIGGASIVPGFADEVRGVVGAAGALVDTSLRVWAQRGHVDASAFVDSGGGDGFRRLVLFEPAVPGWSISY